MCWPQAVGGNSAGLAVLSEFVYGATEDQSSDADLSSREVLQDPYSKRVTLERDFPESAGIGKYSHRQSLRGA